MGIRRTMEESSFVHIEPGMYPVTCLSVKADTLENATYGDGSVIRFQLRFDDVLDENGEEVTRDVIANDKLTPMSKLTGFLQAFGVKANVGEEIDIEECQGKSALARVIERRKDDKVYDRVEDLLPAQKQTTTDPKNNISDFWKAVKEKGFEVSEITQTVQDMYGKAPKDLTPEERESVLESL